MKILSLAVLTLALPMAVFAGSSVDYTDSGGTLAGSNGGLVLTGRLVVRNLQTRSRRVLALFSRARMGSHEAQASG